MIQIPPCHFHDKSQLKREDEEEEETETETKRF
jgi:hypothetical protein